MKHTWVRDTRYDNKRVDYILWSCKRCEFEIILGDCWETPEEYADESILNVLDNINIESEAQYYLRRRAAILDCDFVVLQEVLES